MSIEDTKKYFEGFPEAPASDSFKWVDPQGFEHLSTIRAWHFKPLLDAFTDAQTLIIAAGGKPVNNSPQPAPALEQKVQERDTQGLPVVDGDGKAVMIPLTEGTRIFTVAHLFHDQTKSGKDVLKVVTLEAPYNTKYGVNCFRGGPDNWKTWALGLNNTYLPDPGFKHVVIRDPVGESKYPEIVEFRV